MNKPPLPLVVLTLMLGVVLIAAPAWARDDQTRPIDERRPLKPNATVSVCNVAGQIEIEAWEKNELHLTGELAEEVEELKITGNESRLEIEVKLPERSKHVGDTTLRLRVPVGASIDAEAVSADIGVRGLKGKAVVAESVSGDVRVDVGSKEVWGKSVSGDVTVKASSEKTRVESVSGDVEMRGGRGVLRAESVSGNVTVQARDVKELDIESVSGDLDVDIELAKEAEVEVETLSGEVTMTVPSLPDIDVDLETFSGALRSDLLEGLRGKKEYSRDGKQSGRVRLHSFSGDIHLKKK